MEGLLLWIRGAESSVSRILNNQVFVFHCGGVESRHWELSDEFLDIDLELVYFWAGLYGCVEILEELAGGKLNLECDLDCAVEEVSNLSEVVLVKSSGGEGRGSNANASWGEGGFVAKNCVLVQCDGAVVANSLHL